MVSNVWIQKFSLWIKHCRKISLAFFVLVSLSIIMNFACLVKLWFYSHKCLHANLVLEWEIFTLFQWLFSLILKAVSGFPTYCFLHNVHSINYMTYALEQIVWWKILYDSWICWLLKVDVAVTCCSTEVCYFLNTANIYLVLKCFCLFSSQCRFRFGCGRWVPWNFCCILKM